MPNDTYLLMGLGVGAVIVVWLVFSVLKKVFGLVVLAALAVAGFIVWNNPALLQQVKVLAAGWL